MQAKDHVESTLSSGVDSSTTSWPLTSGTDFPDPTSCYYWVSCWNTTDYTNPKDDPNYEEALVKNKAGDVLTVERGIGDRTAYAHNTGGKTYAVAILATVGNIYNQRGYNVRDWGARGDGSTDDRAAIQACIDAATVAGECVIVPAGHYRITTSPLKFAVDSDTTADPLWIKGEGSGVSEIYQETANQHAFHVGNSSWTTRNIRMQGFRLGTVDGSGDGLRLIRIDRSQFEDICIPFAGDACLFGQGLLGNKFTDIKLGTGFEDNTVAGASIGGTVYPNYCLYLSKLTGSADCNANTFVNLLAYGGSSSYYTTQVVYIGPMDVSTGGGNTFYGGWLWGYSANATFYVSTCAGLKVHGMWVEGTPGSGYYGFQAVQCQSCVFDFQRVTMLLDDCRACEVKGLVSSLDLEPDTEGNKIDIIPHPGGSLAPNVPCAVILDRGIGNIIGQGGALQNYDGFLTGIQSRENLISVNGTLEKWSGSSPLNYTVTECTCAQESSVVKWGTYSAKISDNTRTDRGAGLYYRIPSEFMGQWISVEAWIRPNATSMEGVIMGRGAGTSGQTVEHCTRHENSGAVADWQKHHASFYYDSGYDTSFDICIGIARGHTEATDIVYVDGIKIWSEWNPYDDIVALADDATPSVKAPGSRNVFKTGGTTTITDFDDGYVGQEITIVSEHSVTITDGTNIILENSTNWAMVSGDVLRLLFKDDEKWYEIGRVDTT